MQIRHRQKPRPAAKTAAAETTRPHVCGNCGHFKSYADQPNGTPSDGGECRRNPPQVVVSSAGAVGMFVGVRKADIWCGEWRKA